MKKIPDYVMFEDFAAMYGCSVEAIKVAWEDMAYLSGNPYNIDQSIDDRVGKFNLNRMHKKLKELEYGTKYGYYTDDLGYILKRKAAVIKQERRVSVGLTLDTATIDAMDSKKVVRSDFIIEALKVYLDHEMFDTAEREKYAKNGHKMFRIFNIPEEIVNNLEKVCDGKRIKSKLVEIAAWQKLNAEVKDDK